MSEPFRLRYAQQRTFSAHHMPLRAARIGLDEAERHEPGELYRCLTSITFSAVGTEALVNAVSSRIDPDWLKRERDPTELKLEWLVGALGLQRNPQSEPWSTVTWLLRVRNDIAHAKPELIESSRVITQQHYDAACFEMPEAKLERELTLGNARRAVAAAESLKDMLCSAVPVNQRLGLFVDGSSHSIARE